LCRISNIYINFGSNFCQFKKDLFTLDESNGKNCLETVVSRRKSQKAPERCKFTKREKRKIDGKRNKREKEIKEKEKDRER
jgi:hypothetical protein